MDLLADIGAEDQLISARTENATLKAKVKELTEQVKVLTVDNAALLAEVEIYRKEAALPTFSKLALGQAPPDDDNMDLTSDYMPGDDFVRAGNGVYPSEAVVTLHNLHGSANPLCCALNENDTILASGGADSHLVLCQWGAALSPSPNASAQVVQSAARIPCGAPVICTAFSAPGLVAAGCMDGSIHVCMYETIGGQSGLQVKPVQVTLKHSKYVKDLAWSPVAPILATASADGNIYVTMVNQECMETLITLHLPGTVECLCFSRDGTTLFCYARDTPYLSCFDVEKKFEQTKVNLNKGGGANGGFEDHVSFAVMNMSVSPNDKYIVLATDASRNIVLEIASGKQVRNLYGHMNDEFSQPKVGWSHNNSYILGNSQEESCICVWDIASSNIVQRLEGHSNPIRALYSSPQSDVLVTTSFDKMTKIWMPPIA
jgi:WD40 repeat protein